MNELDKIKATSHVADGNRTSVHKAVIESSTNRNFIFKAIKQMEGIRFPV